MKNPFSKLFGKANAKPEFTADIRAQVKYRFDMCVEAVAVITEFGKGLEGLGLNDVPDSLAPTQGWSIRLEGLSEYNHLIEGDDLRRLYHAINAALNPILRYLQNWTAQYEAIDPLLRDYEVVPAMTQVIDSVSTIGIRCDAAQQLLSRELELRRG